ncbi:chlororespiratory reduction protein 7 [Cyanobacterium aponinum AL20118]|uniref:Chlororespiratory reduction protein 7 n=1 Tax=Cyanobacterium aponinum AL20115 TaxID=3090662 RepID=A0AAF0ZAE4_9CHRO|nr:chlororespiratory reduction protein 7 [Cyanobacterium aponinum]WPF89386.1 chlororespiratory reduction protein 7 [Cyanobacterium aponinum AL20115]
MVDSIMYQEDGYVVLEPNQPEQLLTEMELLQKLEQVIESCQDIPSDINSIDSLSEKAKYLLENYCEFNIDDDNSLQWYVVRWEKR